ncbi:hypothetical protein IV203_004587 [Nitzschia inconspicua]|uniref:Uncharacterized protein n=1 Tax=Nitzschia inconspicua TaxID=303405 RepID=A0A9K3L5L1_9STRA|nr:hypothetical protein IV203_004587 [Nitzschia inconspicua]
MPEQFKDDTSRQTAQGPKFNWQFFGIAMGFMVITFGVIIGTLVSQNNKLDTSDPTPAPVESTNATNVTLGCESMMKDFDAETMVVTMNVASTISAIEIEYAANVFEKTYGAMLANELSQAQAAYCDPYCRKITDVEVSANSLTTSATSSARQSSSCDSSLALTFSVKGTWFGCEDTAWPGLFAPEGRRALKKSLRRILEETEETDTCSSCPDSAQSLGLVSPSMAQLKEVMSEFVAVLPAICEVTDVQLVVPSV